MKERFITRAAASTSNLCSTAIDNENQKRKNSRSKWSKRKKNYETTSTGHAERERSLEEWKQQEFNAIVLYFTHALTFVFPSLSDADDTDLE